jgi:hypothetical protein
MPYLVELALFLLPLGAYLVWRRANPSGDAPAHVLVLAALAVAASLAAFAWYGVERSMERGTVYVPPRLVGDSIDPWHAEPRR